MFIQRLCSSIVLLGLFGASIFWQGLGGRICFTVLAIAGVIGSVYEFCNMLKKKDMPSYPMVTAIAMLIPVFAILIKTDGLVLTGVGIVIAFCAGLWIALLCSGNRLEVLKKIMNSAAVFFLLIIPFIMLTLMYDKRNLFLYMIVGTKIGDIGAYVVGSLSNKITKGGNHKLIPSISPGKSWEGFIGGMIISIGFALAVFPWASGGKFPLWSAVIPGIMLFLSGAAGDLAESSLKRICEIKDSGKIIPGIGGVMDLVDSLLLATPVFAVVLFVMDKCFS